MYGTPTKEQARVIRPFVRGKVVHDLGAGDLRLSKRLRSWGAERVVALDKKLPRKIPEGVDFKEGYFKDFTEAPEVVWLSWPVNHEAPGLVGILERTPLVLYLGTNTNGTACGGQDLWRHLRTREVLAYEADLSNTLIVYGVNRVERGLCGEEVAALDDSKWWTFQEAEKASQLQVNALGCASL